MSEKMDVILFITNLFEPNTRFYTSLSKRGKEIVYVKSLATF